ncbi:hypothetical protein LCS82_08040 [Vibrio harveyi]|uniref:hypothetical protein n=1 Tax=Vibrio harveyi TaxID=669 RepID=UPI003BB6DB81
MKKFCALVISLIVGLLLISIGMGWHASTTFVSEPKMSFSFDEGYKLVHPDSFVQKVVDHDAKQGAIHNKPYEAQKLSKAKQFVDKWLVLSEEISASSTSEFWLMNRYLTKLNNLAFDYFTYENGRAVESYYRQYADCDLYSLLIKSAAALKGIELDLIFAPGHAFINWNNPDGPDVTWEATSNKPVNFDNKLYKPDFTVGSYTTATANDMLDVVEIQYLITNKKDFSEEQLTALTNKYISADSPYSVLSFEVFSKDMKTYDSLVARDPDYAVKAYAEHPSDTWLASSLHEHFSKEQFYDEGKVEYLRDRIIFSPGASFDARYSVLDLTKFKHIAYAPDVLFHGLVAYFYNRFDSEGTLLYEKYQLYGFIALLCFMVYLCFLPVIFASKKEQNTDTPIHEASVA